MQSTSSLASSSWEAFRLTSKAPGELLHTLGPHGVDDLVRQMLAACWRESDPDGRSLATVRALAEQVFERNMKVWSAIKKPSPAAFFENLLPYPADGFLRQAMILCWMMMPRGKRNLALVRQVITQIFQRNLAAWDEDNQTFTKGPVKRKKPRVVAKKKSSKRR